MPKAFCGLEMCAKKLRELCVLCEKKNPMNKRMRQKRSVKSVSSVRDNTSQWFAWVSSHSEGAYFFSQNNTDEQNT